VSGPGGSAGVEVRRVAVAGGTGVAGRLVVAELASRGVEVVSMSRSSGVDLVRGEGLDESLRGVDAVVDASGTRTTSGRVSVRFAEAATARLLAAAHRARVPHALVLSIVGADTVDFGYYLGERRQEELTAAGPVPWTLLRTTQFHQFAGQLLARLPGPLVPVPAMRSAPVAAHEVASRLVDLALGAPQGVVRPLRGPEVLEVADMARRVLGVRGERRAVVRVRLPGRAGAGFAAGALVPDEPCDTATTTFAEHLYALAAEGAGTSGGGRR